MFCEIVLCFFLFLVPANVFRASLQNKMQKIAFRLGFRAIRCRKHRYLFTVFYAHAHSKFTSPWSPALQKKTANIPDVMPFLLGLPISSPPKSSQAFQVRPRLRGVGRQILEPRMVQGLRRRQPLRQVLLQQRRDEGTAVLADLLPATRLAGNLPWRISM